MIFFQKFIGVPVYEDGESCGAYTGGHPVPEWEHLDKFGDITKQLITNADIHCPNHDH